MDTKNFLALDWGKTKVGVALAHAETRVALALGTFVNDETLLPGLRQLIERECVGTLIIGKPAHKGHGNSGERAQEFGERLGKELGLTVIYRDEAFTSKMAQTNLREARKRQKNDDAEAARVLLAEFLTTVQT